MKIEGLRWIDFIDNIDERGRLTAIESEITVPFPIKRVFLVHQVRDGEKRGGHAHRDTDQVLTALNGSLDVIISDGAQHTVFCLDDPGKGLFVPRMLWISMFNFSPGSVFLVFASTNYDRAKSIRAWDEYLKSRNLPLIEEPCK